MKLSANEEYGLRCLVRIGYAGAGGSVTIPEMSQAEGVSPAYARRTKQRRPYSSLALSFIGGASRSE